MDFTLLAYIDDSGYHFADFPTFLQTYQNAYIGVYGSDVYLGSDSQDGQWITIQAQAAYDQAALGASVYNSFSPATAQGLGLARVVKINGLTKGIPTNSSVILTLVGQNGTQIGNGTDANRGIAIDDFEQQWLLPLTVTIPISGTINVTATSKDAGAINAAPGTITTIFTPTLGWQTVTNVSAALPGNAVETDAELRVRQQNSTNLPAQTVLSSTAAAISDLDGVTDVKPYENDGDLTDSNGLTPHSVCFVVDGTPNLQAVANTIGLKKTQGTNTFRSGPNGQTQTYTDPGGLVMSINFISPATIATIDVNLNITPLTGYTSAVLVLIATALEEFIENFGIGAILPFTEFYLPSYLAGTAYQGTFNVSGLQTQKNGAGFGVVDIPLGFTERPVAGAIVVTPI